MIWPAAQRWIDGLSTPKARRKTSTRDKLRFEQQPAAIYAIGDVHGRLDLLRALEARIIADAAAFAGDRWIVLLGDYIDRGPQSASIIDHLLRPLAVPGMNRLCLAGNHEVAMLEFLREPSLSANWLEFGGAETLLSYGIDVRRTAGLSPTRLRALVDSHVPNNHVEFLEQLPVQLETPGQIFVHAGLNSELRLNEQSETDLLWTKYDPAETFAVFGKTVVNGHTPVTEPIVLASRVSIDTGAYATGRLSAVRFCPDLPPAVFVEDSSKHIPRRS